MDDPMMDDIQQQHNQEDLPGVVQEQHLDALFSESDLLFLEEIDNPNLLTNDVDAGKHIWAYRRMKEKQEKLKQTKKEFLEFFKSKEESIEKGIEFIENKLQSYLETKGDNVVCPAGTAFLQTRNKVSYPDDEVLLEYSKNHGVPFKTKESPYKSEIKKFIEEGGEPPEGYSVSQQTSVTIRRT